MLTANVAAIIAETPVASPSSPSVKFAAFETAVTIKITNGINNIHSNEPVLSPKKKSTKHNQNYYL